VVNFDLTRFDPVHVANDRPPRPALNQTLDHIVVSFLIPLSILVPSLAP
jgi:hypothetical protein